MAIFAPESQAERNPFHGQIWRLQNNFARGCYRPTTIDDLRSLDDFLSHAVTGRLSFLFCFVFLVKKIRSGDGRKPKVIKVCLLFQRDVYLLHFVELWRHSRAHGKLYDSIPLTIGIQSGNITMNSGQYSLFYLYCITEIIYCIKKVLVAFSIWLI